jgi:hypothetical protein
MPLQKILFKPGVNRENTRYTTEGGWYECDKIRFRQGNPEKIGGWTRFSVNQFLGVCRSLWNWATLKGQNLVSAGTDKKFYINQGGFFFDITPIRSTVVLTNPFSVASAGISTVTVADVDHGCVTGSYVTYSGAGIAGLGGNINAAKLTGEFVITSIIDDDTYTITVDAVSNATDVSGSPGGGTVVTQYQVNVGPATQAPVTGWGAGPWGAGTWGVGTEEANPLQLWNARNFGQDLIYGARGQGVYYWNANKAVEPVQITITIAAPGVITMPAGYSLVDGTLVQFESTGALPTGLTVGATYFVVSASGNTFSVSSTIAGPPITTSGMQSGLQFISQRGVNIYGVEDANAPILHNYLLVSDSSRFVILFGSNEFANDALDPMLIRWSDQESPFVWTPSATNQAGSIRLSIGSEIIAAIQTRQEIVVLTDEAVYSMQYLGPPFVWGIQSLGDNISVAGPNAVSLASGVVYWMGVDKFYMYDGRVQTLNCDLRRFIFNDFNRFQNQQVFSGTNEGFNEVWWFYCSANSTVVDRYVIFNYMENAWYYGSMERSAWLDSGLLPYPIAATYSNNIVNQEVGVDDLEDNEAAPVPIEAYISSSEFDIGDGHNFGFIWRMLPDLTFNGSDANAAETPQVEMTLYPLQNSGSGTGTPAGASVTEGSTYVITEEFTGQIYTRVRGRQLIFKVGSTRAGTTWQLGAPRIDIRQDGRR